MVNKSKVQLCTIGQWVYGGRSMLIGGYDYIF